ncbi:late control D family protein [Clostridium aceticum]|uniref:Late control D family protein n=1 Tax=Clostridium aceticum TaxID=84022 RepID=A0A0G3WAX4_9CLOT|nr:contractile injection system protein, VgrG/Pvc8 family [Clostridium aceticum]AKL95020.1 late control D family protein [Clostridium aceticum]
MLARRADIAVKYSGIDITSDIKKDLLVFSYTDNASENADDVSILLKDNKLKWLNQWFPQKGDSLESEINTMNWRFDGDRQSLPCGSSIIDEPEYSGRPRVLTLKAISIPANSNFTTTNKSRVWNNITFKTIAQDIANQAGLSLFFDSKSNPIYARQEQSEVSDMKFLAELCKNEGLAFKVTDKKIVIFDEAEYEKRPSVAKFKESSSTLKRYNFKTTFTDTAYAGCNVKYYDAALGRNIEFLFALKDIDPEKDKVYELNARVKTGEEAKRLAQKTLRKINKKEYRTILEVAGDINIVGGSCIDLEEFGVFSGKYYVDKAIHNYDGGYSVSIEGHKVLEGY